MSREIIWDDFSERKADRDLGLDIEGTIFWVSRKELAEASPIFKAMLYGDFREKEKEIIQLPKKSAEEILEFLRCLFPTGTEFKAVDDENVNFLLSLADEYEIKKLTEKCSEFLMTKIEQATKEEKIDLFVTGVRYKLKDVVRGTILEIRKLGASEIPEFDDMPLEVKHAVTMSVRVRGNVHVKGELTSQPLRWKTISVIMEDDEGGIAFQKLQEWCKYCNENIDSDNESEDDPCLVCHSCRKAIESDDETKICQCIDPLIMAELEKAGV